MNIDKYGLLRIKQIDKGNLAWFKKYDRFLKEISQDGKMLEIGPGNGDFSFYCKNICKLANENIHLLDGSSSTIALLKKQDETKEFQIHLNDIVSFLGDSPKDTFDLIVARHVLEHMDKNYLEKLIPLLERNLTENGSILIEVPNVGNFPYGLYYSFFDFTHITHFTFESLAEAFLLNGNNLKVETFNVVFPLEFRGKSIAGRIKELLSKAFLNLSTVITYLFMRVNGDRIGSGAVYSPFILCRITKTHE